MKKSILYTTVFVLLLQIISENAFGQWHWVNPNPQGNTLNSISSLSSSDIWVGGQKGVLMHTTNGGITWAPKFTGYFDDFSGIYFATSSKGYIVQGSYFLQTANGGVSWTVKNYFSGMNIRKMFFLNNDSGWVSGNNGIQEQLLFTADGGVNWTVQNTPAQSIKDIQMIPGGHGWFVCSDGLVFSTVDFGQSWFANPCPGNPVLNNIQFIDNLNGFVSGDQGTLYKSADGGLTWNQINNPAISTSIGLNAIYFNNVDTGIVAGTDGLILQTTDGGVSWNSIGVTGWFTGYAIAAVSSQNLFLIGTNGEILFSDNYGSSWTSQQSRITENNLNSVVALSSSHVFACGDNGVLLESTNGGQAWTLANSTVGDNLNAITFANADTGLAVGNFGQMIRTSDGGATWSTITSNTGEELLTVCKVNATTFLAGGRNAALITSTDGGLTWSDVTTILTGSANVFTDIYFTSKDSGWIATDGSQVLYTYDGGANWNISVIPTAGPITSLFFTDNNNGWLCTGNAEILNTTDAGATWNSNANNFLGTFGKIIFTDSQNGWVLGANQILRTDNGGVTWNDEIDPTVNTIKDAVFLNGTDAIAVGLGIGTIIARTGDMHISVPTADICTDVSYNISLTTNGTFNAGNHFNVELSDNFGSFLFPYQIGSVTATSSSVIYITIPGGISDGPGYRLRVVSTDPPSYSPSYSGVLTVHTSPTAYAVAAGPTAFCQGDSVVIYTDYSPTWTYQWFKDGVPVTGATADSIVANQTGNFTVTVSDGVCTLTSPIVDVLVSTCTGIAGLSTNFKYKAAPNPTNGNVTINWPSAEHVDNITVRDVSGRIVDLVLPQGKNTVVLNMETFNSGVYFLSMNGSSPGVLKVVKY